MFNHNGNNSLFTPTTLTLSSHNVNGFNGSKEFLHSRCESEKTAILAIQEHWLKPSIRKHQGIDRLKTLHPRYDGYGTSAMTKKMGDEIMKGRPFGGTGFLFSKNLSLNIKPCVQYIHDRVSVLELKNYESTILLINAYLPFYDTRNLADQTDLFKNTVGYIESIIRSNSACKFILTMDMNCNIFNPSHAFSKIMIEFMKNNGLMSTFDLIPNFSDTDNFTRCDVKTNSYTLIDGILISKSLSNLVSNVRISHCGDNTSDHSPVEIDLVIGLGQYIKPKQVLPEFIPWSNLADEDLMLFQNTMERELDKIAVPHDYILHGNTLCDSHDHLFAIEDYYDYYDFFAQGSCKCFQGHRGEF